MPPTQGHVYGLGLPHAVQSTPSDPPWNPPRLSPLTIGRRVTRPTLHKGLRLHPNEKLEGVEYPCAFPLAL